MFSCFYPCVGRCTNDGEQLYQKGMKYAYMGGASAPKYCCDSVGDVLNREWKSNEVAYRLLKEASVKYDHLEATFQLGCLCLETGFSSEFTKKIGLEGIKRTRGYESEEYGAAVIRIRKLGRENLEKALKSGHKKAQERIIHFSRIDADMKKYFADQEKAREKQRQYDKDHPQEVALREIAEEQKKQTRLLEDMKNEIDRIDL